MPALNFKSAAFSFSFIHSTIGYDCMFSMLISVECLQRKDVYCLINFWLNVRFWKYLPPNSAHYQVI